MRSNIYDCFSASFQHGTSLLQYGEVFAKTREVRLVTITLLNSTLKRSSAEVILIATGVTRENEVWKGVIEFAFERDVWKIDTMKGLKKAVM